MTTPRDHAGGNLELSHIYPHLPIYGGYKDNPSAATMRGYIPIHYFTNWLTSLLEVKEINICGLSFDAMCTPSRTYNGCVIVVTMTTFNLYCIGHIILKSTTPSCLFTGDHLFIAGCGKSAWLINVVGV